jgi:hypothetical protein
MKDTFDIVEKADQLRRKSKSDIVIRMVQQTTECAWFIRDYMKIEEFCKLDKLIVLSNSSSHSCEGKRMAKNIVSSRKDQVDKFKSKFEELRSAFETEAIVEVEIAVLRVADDLQSVKKDLKELGMRIARLFLSLTYCCPSH